MKFIIILNATDDEPATLATRTTFDSMDEAKAYVARWDATWQAQATIVRCPQGSPLESVPSHQWEGPGGILETLNAEV